MKERIQKKLMKMKIIMKENQNKRVMVIKTTVRKVMIVKVQKEKKTMKIMITKTMKIMRMKIKMKWKEINISLSRKQDISDLYCQKSICIKICFNHITLEFMKILICWQREYQCIK